jgi:Condensation domain
MSASLQSLAYSGAQGSLDGRQSPLSYAQETMLYWDRLVPRSSVYNVPKALRIQGGLDIRALQKAVRLVLSRHEVLRSRFLFTDEDPMQVVGSVPDESACVSVVDLPNVAGDLLALKQAVNSEAQRPFSLSKDLMLRATVLRTNPSEHILVLTMHHIASDGWSLGTLLSELSEAYPAFSEGKDPQLPPLPAQYADFAKWQRKLLQEPERDRLLSFWREQLAGLSESSELLPLDGPRPAQQTFEGEIVRTVLPESLIPRLTELGQMRRASLFMVTLAAFQTLLRCCSGQADIPVGVPVANRTKAEFLDVIGCFINMVVVRSNLSGNPTFLDFLGQVRETSLAAFFNPELPFSELVRHLHPKRNTSYTPFFQVQFAFQNFPMPAIRWAGAKVSLFEIEMDTSKFDLTVSVEHREGLRIAFEYNRRLFHKPTMERLLRRYASLLQKIVRDPELHIDAIGVDSLENYA